MDHLKKYLLAGTLMVSLRQKALGQQLFRAASELDVKQSVVRITDFSMTEATEAELNHGSVV